MRKIQFSVLAVIAAVQPFFAQVSASDIGSHAVNVTSSAGMEVHPDRIRSAGEGFASEEFRRGVQAYYKGAFNEALMQFEKSLSYMPDDSLILDWLGRTYYRAGLEGSALSYWQTASDNGYGGLLLQNKIEVVRERRVTGDSPDKLMRLSESGSFPGEFNGNMVFSGPVSVLPNSDGTIWVTSYNSNELMLMNQNGKVIDRITGPLNGFDRPFDVARLKDGSLLVSESAGDRLALLDSGGRFRRYIAERGRGTGQVVGPQYIAVDRAGRIYVTDYGNRRVDVFDSDGTGLYFFGGSQPGFRGLSGPTGIAVGESGIFVADDGYGLIVEFDRAGNFIRNLVEPGTFSRPESVKFWNGGLLVCDSNRIVSVDTETGAVFDYVRTGNGPTRVLSAVPDINGNVIAADFPENEIYIMSKVQELVGGLFVQIEQVDASKFPAVTVELRVENRHRQPLVGLQEENFYLTEGKRPVSDMKFTGAASNNTYADVTVVIDRSRGMDSYSEEAGAAVREIAGAMEGKGTLRIVSAGNVPVTEYSGRPEGALNFTPAALRNPVSDRTSVDLALRLAANDLMAAAKKRAVIFVSDGKTADSSFSRYNLAELAAYMSNNSVGFSMVQLAQSAVSDELGYILDNTAGDLYYIYRAEGLSSVVTDIIDIPQGIYQFSYTSALSTEFGQKYLPIEAEVYLLKRSGRDESGYFAPLQ